MKEKIELIVNYFEGCDGQEERLRPMLDDATEILKIYSGFQWQLIDKNTPHDGTMLLLSDNQPEHLEDKWVVAGSYEKANRKTGHKIAGWYNQFEIECPIFPTHWMFLPNPPAKE